MAEYQDRTGALNTGDPAPDTIEAQWIRKLERDLWVRFWGPGVACSDWDSNTEYDRATGWNQTASYDAGTPGTGTARAGMGDISGNPDSHLSAGSGISTSDPRDATGYGKYTVRANITNASQNTTCVITCPGHGLLHDSASGTPHEDGTLTLSVPNKIQIVGVPANSMHELNCDNVNNQFFYAKVIDNDTLALYTDVTHASGVTTFNTSYDSFGNTPWLFGSTEGYVNFVVDFESGTGNTGNYETTTTIARDQYIALQKRVNTAISRTGQSTQATGTSVLSVGVLPLVQTKAMYESDGTTQASSLNEDTGRVRADHVNKLSDEIEHIGSPLNTNIASLGTYNFHKLLVNGIYASNPAMNNHDARMYDDQVSQTGLWDWDDAWGSDTWSSSGIFNTWPWNAGGGQNHGRDRPFIEARMTFNNWNHLRYWFNQGGCCLFHPNFNGDGSMGGWMWQNLARANNPLVNDGGTSMVFAGQHAPYYEHAALISSSHITFREGGYNIGWPVTADCPRVHGFGDKTPAAYFNGGGGATSNGTTITVSSTTNMAANDILHLGDWLGEIKTIVNTTTVELYRIIRKIDQTEYVPGNHPGGDGDLSELAWACSKWYRACQYDGNQGLYGDEGSPPEGQTPVFPNDDSSKFLNNQGFIHYDWRFVKDPGQSNKPCIFYRMMYDNSGTNCTVHGTGEMELGSRRPSAYEYFYPEQGATHPVVTNDKASTAEDDYHSSTNPSGRNDGLNRINDGFAGTGGDQ